jgi:membrane protein YdbS with pleckstrin-like domain
MMSKPESSASLSRLREDKYMTCSKCGAYVTPSVRFCSNCGEAVDAEATRLARVQSRALEPEIDPNLEQTIFTVRPTMVFIKTGYAIAVVAGIALVFLLATLGLSATISIPVALALLLIPAYYHIRRNMVRYTVTDSKLQIDTGLIARTTRNIPLSKVQDVTVSATIPQRLLGFGDIIVDNASDLGGHTVMHNISKPRQYADLLLRELRRWH